MIAGEDGQAWCEAARQLAAEADAPLDALRIGRLGGDYHDPRCCSSRRRPYPGAAFLVELAQHRRLRR